MFLLHVLIIYKILLVNLMFVCVCFVIIAQVNRRGLVILLPLVYASYIVGFMAQHDQDVALFGIFTILNGILGGCIFVFHCSGNEDVREKLVTAYMTIMKKDPE